MIVYGIGRLGREPKMQYAANGNAVTNIAAAVKCGFGEKEETVWFDLVAFGKQAETLNQYLEKGKRLSFSAELQGINSFEKKDGTTGVSVKARIVEFTFIDKSESVNEPEEF